MPVRKDISTEKRLSALLLTFRQTVSRAGEIAPMKFFTFTLSSKSTPKNHLGLENTLRASPQHESISTISSNLTFLLEKMRHTSCREKGLQEAN